MASVSSPASRFSSSPFPAASRLHCAAHARVTFRRPDKLRVSALRSSTMERPAEAHIGSPSSLYEVLGLQAGASSQEIKAAYRSLARVLHPDVATTSSADEFMMVHEAYATLSDPQKRADYDRGLITLPRRMGAPFAVSMTVCSGGFPVYTRRKWETDQCW